MVDILLDLFQNKQEVKMEKTLKEFMAEEKSISRWTILVAGIAGGFCGAIGAVGFMLTALT
jgi:hypothetical protein